MQTEDVEPANNYNFCKYFCCKEEDRKRVKVGHIGNIAEAVSWKNKWQEM